MQGHRAEAEPRAVLSIELLPASCRNLLQKPPAASSPPAPCSSLTPISGAYEHRTDSVPSRRLPDLTTFLLGLTLPQITAQPLSLPAHSAWCSSRCLCLSPSFKTGMQEGREERGAEQGASLRWGRGAGPPDLGHGRWLSCSNSPLKSQVLTACALRCRKGPDLATAHGDPRGSPHRLEVTCW